MSVLLNLIPILMVYKMPLAQTKYFIILEQHNLLFICFVLVIVVSDL